MSEWSPGSEPCLYKDCKRPGKFVWRQEDRVIVDCTNSMHVSYDAGRGAGLPVAHMPYGLVLQGPLFAHFACWKKVGAARPDHNAFAVWHTMPPAPCSSARSKVTRMRGRPLLVWSLAAAVGGSAWCVRRTKRSRRRSK